MLSFHGRRAREGRRICLSRFPILKSKVEVKPPEFIPYVRGKDIGDLHPADRRQQNRQFDMNQWTFRPANRVFCFNFFGSTIYRPVRTLKSCWCDSTEFDVNVVRTWFWWQRREFQPWQFPLRSFSSSTAPAGVEFLHVMIVWVMTAAAEIAGVKF